MATWRLNFIRMLTLLFGRPGIIWGALAVKPLASACRVKPNEAEEGSEAATRLGTKVPFTLMFQVAFSFWDRTGLGSA